MTRRSRIRKGHRVPYGGSLRTKYRRTPNGCWLRRGALDHNGYGVVRRGSRIEMAHRAVYREVVKAEPPRLEFHHTCGVRRCVNPAHGQWVLARHHNNFGRWR